MKALKPCTKCGGVKTRGARKHRCEACSGLCQVPSCFAARVGQFCVDCLRERNTTQAEMHAWFNARRRVTNPFDQAWKDYGGRGIRMCTEWLNDFSAFLGHIGPRPEGMTLDRINNDGNYEPGNVRWTTRSEQRLNQRRVV